MFDTRAAASLHVGRKYDIPCRESMNIDKQ
jgi:hypothetical protein